jgi:hypothetical protein
VEPKKELATPSTAPAVASDDPLAGLDPKGIAFLNSLPEPQRALTIKNIRGDPASPAEPPPAPVPASTGNRAATQKRKPLKIPRGKSWGPLFADLVATKQFQQLGARDLHVLSAFIASRNNNDGECAPGRNRVVALTGYLPRTVDRSVLSLKEQGLIRQTKEAHSGQNAAFRVAEDGEEIAQNLQERATPKSGALSTPERATPNTVAH